MSVKDYFCSMIYNVIGLMSGSSLDGLDIAYVRLEEVRGNWSFEILEAQCTPYSEEWVNKLRNGGDLRAGELFKLDTSYGRMLAETVNSFIQKRHLDHKVHFIASHGHTVFHEPHNFTTGQIGNGATLAALTGLPVINDLRSTDVALGGQGAPIVPIGDKLLFGEYDYLLNIGGIANLTARQKDGSYIAFDICPANQVLNALAGREGLPMDDRGSISRQGNVLPGLIDALESAAFYKKEPPRSLSNEEAISIAAPLLKAKESTADLLHTAVVHIATQLARAVRQLHTGAEPCKMLVTGGGALNDALMETIAGELAELNIDLVVPDEKVVKYKEALVMALLGALRWREEVTVLCSVSGASRDSVGGALWLS